VTERIKSLLKKLLKNFSLTTLQVKVVAETNKVPQIMTLLQSLMINFLSNGIDIKKDKREFRVGKVKEICSSQSNQMNEEKDFNQMPKIVKIMCGRSKVEQKI
jgi:hypothetical protein